MRSRVSCAASRRPIGSEGKLPDMLGSVAIELVTELDTELIDELSESRIRSRIARSRARSRIDEPSTPHGPGEAARKQGSVGPLMAPPPSARPSPLHAPVRASALSAYA